MHMCRLFRTFRSKMIALLLLLTLLATLLLTAISIYSVSDHSKLQLTQAMGQVANNKLGQVSAQYNVMEDSIQFILSNPEMLQSITALSHEGDPHYSTDYINTAKKSLAREMRLNYLGQNVYRVLYYNEFGQVYSSSNAQTGRIVESFDLTKIPYITSANKKLGKNILVAPHTDNWGYSEKPMVYSVVKKIHGENLGYLEVQNKQDHGMNMTDIPQGFFVTILLNGKDILFTNATDSDFVKYQTSMAASGNSAIENSYQGDRKRTVISRDKKRDVCIVVSCSEEIALLSYLKLSPVFIGSILLFIICSILLLLLVIRRFLRPLSLIQGMIEQTSLETIPDLELHYHNYDSEEFVHIQKAYIRMAQRLREAISKENSAEFLRLQAQFDMLQAQVNPHFIYNVLNIISAQAVAENSEGICDTCSELAEMLRYSTDTTERYVPLKKEIEGLEHYIYLLQARWQDKIVFEISIVEDMQSILVPKMFLQQLIENCVSHAFTQIKDIREVVVKGYINEEGYYILEVFDNGVGFSEDSLIRLQKAFDRVKGKLKNLDHNIEDKIGGMGLKNAYARLYILYGTYMHMFIGNNEKGSAFVKVIFRKSLDDSKIHD